MDENPLLDFLLADLAWGKRPRVRTEMPTVWVDDVRDYRSDWDRVVGVVMRDREHSPAMVVIQTKPHDPTVAADEAFAREIELAREVCEDAEVDALTQPVPTVTLPFGGDGGSRE